ncbi:hypothetical protein P3T23_006221 [Paraburkholderia sp. GAS448]
MTSRKAGPSNSTKALSLSSSSPSVSTRQANSNPPARATYGVPVKVLLLNNIGDGMIRQWQRLFYDGRLCVSDKSLHRKDFVMAATLTVFASMSTLTFASASTVFIACSIVETSSGRISFFIENFTCHLFSQQRVYGRIYVTLNAYERHYICPLSAPINARLVDWRKSIPSRRRAPCR